MGSGCGDSIVDRILRPPGNSPSRWHLTRRLLLCSRITIHDITENVNTYFIDIPGTIILQPESVASFFLLSCCFRRFSQEAPRTMVLLNF